MNEQHEKETEERLRQLSHDIGHCLHVIGMAMEILKSARDNEEVFGEVCASIDKERKEATKLLHQLHSLGQS